MGKTLLAQTKKDKTELVLRNIYNLPPIPKVMMEAMELLNDKSTRTQTITATISRDQSLVTKILTIANSPLYGLQREVTNIDFAILLLGYGELRNIISVLSFVEAFQNKSDKYFNQKEFWLHSFLTGSASKKIADDLGFKNSGETFIAGFLHDIGVSIIHRYFHSKFIEICETVESEGIDYIAAESKILGMSHMEAGKFLIERWNFPKSICSGILDHHDPNENSRNASLINLADYMTKKLELGDFMWDKNLELNSQTIEILGFESTEKVEDFIESYRDLFIQQKEVVRYLN